MNPLRSMVEMAGLEGETLAGAGACDVPAIRHKLGITSKLWCAVSSWIVIDVHGASAESFPRPLLPLVLYAQTVIAGDDDRLKVGDAVLSTYATGYDHGPIFETPSRVYILMGTGLRSSADQAVVQAAQDHFARTR
ncbi:DUF6957 family protein [Pseudomonas coronafaciens]|uniref:DUF6957 family protein n=1 Tax=Pseudomonas coronafaciens TaxID=53409 RepID=UPI0005A4D9EE|nr:hypothetical protein [Pseudomonas coronafaciens]KGS13879.1 hypothetical protein OA77_14180 [Pseudomonas coronafaciens]RMV01197.1 hypothetical protein ALP20_200224 [Pseudomonas coronafaciens pv. coronafaciens]